MSAETNGKQTLVLVFAALGVLGTFIAGASVIVDQKVELAVLKTTMAERVGLAVMETRLVEVETQFRAADQIRNIQWAHTLRFDTLLWEKTFPGSRFPSDVAYYPQVARDPK